MSLLNASFETFTPIEKAVQPDGYGGNAITSWTDGTPFYASVVIDRSNEVRDGAVKGTAAAYTITTRRSKTLAYHDVIRRNSDGKIFRITSDGTEKKTPASAGLDMRQVSAEDYTIPDEAVT